VKKAVKAKDKTVEAPAAAREETKQPVPQGDFAARWMRYGLAGLLAVFITGAGWGIHAWLKASAPSSEPVEVAEVSGGEVPDPEPSKPPEVEPPALVSPVTPAASQIDSFIAQDLAATSPSAPGGGDIWSPLSTGAAASNAAASIPEKNSTSITPASSELALQSSEPLVTTALLPSIPGENSTDVDPQTMAPVPPDSPPAPDNSTKQSEILRLSGPEKTLEQTINTPETSKSTGASKAGGKPRLRKKTLEALARLEKRLN